MPCRSKTIAGEGALRLDDAQDCRASNTKIELAWHVYVPRVSFMTVRLYVYGARHSLVIHNLTSLTTIVP